MNRDLYNRVKTLRLFSAKAAVIDNTAQTSATVDTLGYESCIIELSTGVLTDADAIFDVNVKEGSDSGGVGATNVAAGDLQIDPTLTSPATGGTAGAQFSFLFSDDDKVFKIGYKGSQRYLTVVITPTLNTGNLFFQAAVVLSNARHQPAGAAQLP